MASFVEQATLKVNDQSSAAIRKINAELQKLAATARSLKSTTITIRVNDRSIQQATARLRSLQTQLQTVGSRPINLNVNASGITRAAQQIANLRQQASRPININTQAGGGGGGGGAAATRRGLRQTGIQHQIGNFSALRGAGSVIIGGTVYAVAANTTRTALGGVVGSEDARMRLQQSGFTPAQTDLFMAMARKTQEEFSRIPAAAIANASVEQLNAIKANNGTFADYQTALNRIAANAQTMAITFKDPMEGAESARQLERVSQIMGKDVDNAEIRKVQEATMRAIVASGGEMKAAEAVRTLQQLGSSIVKTMSPQALTDLLMIRDEGGRASTAEWRTTIQELMRGSLGKGDKAAMARHGLRRPDGTADPAVVKEAAEDLVGFTERRIVPILKKAGLDQATSAEIATHLDENVGYTTVAARGIADIVTSLRDGELQRQRAAARAVNLDPHLGDQTFRGGSERLRSSFQTAMARALDKTGPAFTEAITPFAVSMDKAGKSAEKGDYGDAAANMTKGVADLMGGTAGAIITAVTTARAVGTLLDPTASPLEKGAAMLVTGSSALLTAAGAIARYFGEGDPNKELAHQQQLEKQLPDQISNYQKLIAEEEAKSKPNRERLAGLNRALAAAEIAYRDVQRNITDAQVRVDAANAEVARVKAEEAAHMERLQRESGLGTGPAATAAAAATPPVASALVQQLRQLSTAGGLAGVKSITDLLKALNQPTSVASREALATSLGYKGPLGGSAAMNKFLLDFFKKLAAEPPAVEPPKEPVTVEPPKEPVVVEPPTEPVAVEPPKEPTVIDQPVQVTPTAPVPTDSEGRPAGHGGAIPPIPPPIVPPIRPITEVLDFDPAKVQFASMFTQGASTIGQSGAQVGENAASTLSGQAGGIGAAIGSAAAAIISSATVNINIPNQSGNKPDTGRSVAI